MDIDRFLPAISARFRGAHDFARRHGFMAGYRSVVERVVEEARPPISAAFTMIPVIGPVLGVASEITMTALKGDITDALSRQVGLEDDQPGSQNIPLSPKRLIELAAKSPLRAELGVPFRFQSQLFTGQGSTYKVAFDVSPG